MAGDILVSVQRLGRRFAARRVLEDIHFELRRGEILGLLGLNGAGKTTTLRILCGTLAPSVGQVHIVGHDMLAAPTAAKQHIGYLPEHPPLYLDSTVDEYLEYCAQLRGLRGQARREALAYGKRACGLEGVGKRLLANLSKGYRQRVAIAQAVLHRPDVVILDEPTVGLDPAQISEIRDLVRTLGEEHSVILSTHLLAEAEMLCNRVLILHLGRLRLDRSLRAESDRASWQACFRRAPEAAALGALPGLERFEPGARAGSWRILPKDAPGQPDDLLQALQRAALEGDWGLYELTPVRRDLEQLFLELVRGHTGDDPAAN